MLKTLTLSLVVIATTGCASSIGSFFNRPVIEDDLSGPLSTVSYSSDRRAVLVAKSNDTRPLFCAEPPPDTATGLKTDLDTTLKHKSIDLSLKDKLETSVTVLSARNAPLDAFRTGIYSLCQFYMVGALEKQDIRPMFETLVKSYEVNQSKIPAILPPQSPGTTSSAPK